MKCGRSATYLADFASFDLRAQLWNKCPRFPIKGRSVRGRIPKMSKKSKISGNSPKKNAQLCTRNVREFIPQKRDFFVVAKGIGKKKRYFSSFVGDKKRQTLGYLSAMFHEFATPSTRLSRNYRSEKINARANRVDRQACK